MISLGLKAWPGIYEVYIEVDLCISFYGVLEETLRGKYEPP